MSTVITVVALVIVILSIQIIIDKIIVSVER